MAEEDREPEVVRIAAVMNGGVSLAVWMGGVTHELSRLLDPATAGSEAWQAVLSQDRARPRRVVVDYVAGTSAGGLNGTLLATALGRGAGLPGLKKLWMDSGSLTADTLLRPGERGRSLLSGAYFLEKVEEAISELEKGTGEVQDVTLLVTATAMGDSSFLVDDAAGQALEVSDHRRVYRFESRLRSDEGRDGFADLGVLGLAARASASFPAAFAPVRESAPLARHLHRRVSEQRTRPWLIDGGVLDNAPFEPLLEEITRNPRPDTGRRWIMYVVPSATGLRRREADTADTWTSVDDGRPPPSWPEVVSSLWGVKSEVDLRADVEALGAAVAATRAVHVRPEAVISAPPLLVPPSDGALFDRYRRTRAAGFVQFLGEQGAGRSQLKQVEVDEAGIDSLLADGLARFIPVDVAPERDGRWQWGSTVAVRLALWMSRHARAHAIDRRLVLVLAELERRVGTVARQTRGLYVGDDLVGLTPAEVVRARAAAAEAPLVELTGLMGKMTGTWARTLVDVHDDPVTRLLATEVLLNFAEWHVDPTFPRFDLVLTDPGMSKPECEDLFGRDDDVRRLANHLAAHPEKKLFGTQLGHFGAFGDRSYREHDWIWGRIDGALRLSRALLAELPAERAGESAELRRALIEEILAEELGDDAAPARDRFRRATEAAAGLDAGGLLADIVHRGEVDVEELAESIESAVDAASERGRWDPVERWVDGVADSLGRLTRAGAAVTRLRGRASTFAERGGRLLGRVWPGGR